jgi:protein TonB
VPRARRLGKAKEEIMGQPARLLLPVTETSRTPLFAVPRRPEVAFTFHSLLLTEPRPLARTRGLGIVIALVFHAILVAAAILVPLLLFEDVVPAADLAVRAFFTAPPDVAAPPPPPPPPPAAVARPRTQAPVPTPPLDPGRFVAPLVVPERIVPDAGIDLGVEGGVPGGVEGGVPGGVLGGVVGGLPSEAPPPPPPAVVRIGGNIRAPKLMNDVKPVFPELALQARLSGLVILEAHVGTDGRVQSVRILRGAPIFDDAAIEAVKQWRYQPLLLNGVPTEFILTVTVSFNVVTPGARR